MRAFHRGTPALTDASQPNSLAFLANTPYEALRERYSISTTVFPNTAFSLSIQTN